MANRDMIKIKRLGNFRYAALIYVYWIRYLSITTDPHGVTCHQGQSFMETKVMGEKKKERERKCEYIDIVEILLHWKYYFIGKP